MSWSCTSKQLVHIGLKNQHVSTFERKHLFCSHRLAWSRLDLTGTPQHLQLYHQVYPGLFYRVSKFSVFWSHDTVFAGKGKKSTPTIVNQDTSYSIVQSDLRICRCCTVCLNNLTKIVLESYLIIVVHPHSFNYKPLNGELIRECLFHDSHLFSESINLVH